jgi:hypothetical protein
MPAQQVPSKAQMGLGAVISIGQQTGTASDPETWTVLGEPVSAMSGRSPYLL